MTFVLDNPTNIEKNLLTQVVDLVDAGEQVTRHFIERGIRSAELIAIYVEDEAVICSATLKNPLKSYRKKVFQLSGNSAMENTYPQELGYIVTHPKHENKKLCQALLAEFLKTIGGKRMFATTRKPAMAHILKKLEFEKKGVSYKTDLELLVYNGSQQNVHPQPEAVK